MYTSLGRLFQVATTATCLLASSVDARGKPYVQPDACTTHYGTCSHHPVPTGHHTTTKTKTCTIIVTTAPTVTTTPSPVISTTFVTSTETDYTSISSTDSITTTVTVITTTTDIPDVVTSTETDSTTVQSTSTSTTTIAATSGFVPVQSSVPGTSYDGAEGGPAPPASGSKKRSAAIEERKLLKGAVGLHKVLARTQFPESVGCTKTVTKHTSVTSTKTISPTTVTAPTVTSTLTSSITTTTTITSIETVDTTITSSTTSTVTSTAIASTTVFTTTSTQTNVVQESATAYAQCQYNNFADELNGQYGIYLLAATNGNYGVNNIGTITNAQDCCNSCASTGNCGVSLYTAASGGCYQLTGCGLDFPLVQASNYDWVVNNGCGEGVPNN